MKKIKDSIKSFIDLSISLRRIYIFTTLFFFLLNIFSFTVHGQVNDLESKVLEAYELRSTGNKEEAKLLLKNVLESDPTNSMAHFEMARISEGARQKYHIDKAIEYNSANCMYHFYKANTQMLEAYKAMQFDSVKVAKAHVNDCSDNLIKVLEINPNCKESMIFLVDIYASLPKKVGGDIKEAKKYQKKLKDVDVFYASKAELIIANAEDDDINPVEHWQKYIEQFGESQQALEELGFANLMNNELEPAEECFNGVMAMDETKSVLHLQIARAHLYRAMRVTEENREKEIEGIKENIQLYLAVDEEKPDCIEAWCYGWLGRLEARQGNVDLAEKYTSMAKLLNPEIKLYTALPNVDSPPNVLAYRYKTYFSPF